ncbi:MAG: hypothetical protein WC356_04285 [Candidatus Micrarchaeia archaeon]|jgi:hypothetical protein
MIDNPFKRAVNYVENKLRGQSEEEKRHENELRFKVGRGRQTAQGKDSEFFHEWMVPFSAEYQAELQKQLYDGATPEIREEARVGLKTIHNLMVTRIEAAIEEGRKAQLELDAIMKEHEPKKDEAVR